MSTVHSKPKTLVCTANVNCPYSSTSNSNMKRHLISTHGIKEKNANGMLNLKLNVHCHLCPHVVSSKKRLIEHLNLNHFSGIQIENCVFDSEEGN